MLTTLIIPERSPLEHGELNIPGRLKNLDRDLLRDKARDQKARRPADKAKTAKHREDKALAKTLHAQHGPAIVARMSAKYGGTWVKAELKRMAFWEPAKFIRLVEQHLKEASASVS